ncbi:hypothetical protein U3A58_07935 [Algoriphagus sp. C2-6-M1]|uniref:hypothetical protein n=1 Tax=Algoriphagus persicinus TaxID=3108754 RepID=UPI002B37ECEB|nr:hypothetical protein [Algoriphagus sp. C2-6-M1]MEB2780320.1 hypothetical protein [Algoriphagus sp. C2-6-M1]
MVRVFLMLGFNFQGFAQCTECGSPRTYTSTNLSINGNVNPSSTGGLNSNKWTGDENFSSGQIAKFDQNLSFTWEASDFTLGGIILTNGADLTLERPNNGENPAFTIEGECILIGAGSTLNLIYIVS